MAHVTKRIAELLRTNRLPRISRRRQFVMTETTWKIIVQVFGDTKCSRETLLLTVDFGGDYELGANSNTVPGAQETRQFYPQAGYADCGWRRFPEAAVRPISVGAGYCAGHRQERLGQAFCVD
jgi:hypothetical protein